MFSERLAFGVFRMLFFTFGAIFFVGLAPHYLFIVFRRFGASLSTVSDPGHTQTPSNDSTLKNKSTRGIGSSSAASASINNPLRSLQEGRRKK